MDGPQAQDIQYVGAIAHQSQPTTASSSIVKPTDPTTRRLVFDGVVISVLPRPPTNTRNDVRARDNPYSSLPPVPESIGADFDDGTTTPSTIEDLQGSKGQLHKLRQREQNGTSSYVPSDVSSRRQSRRVQRYITDAQTIDRLLEAQWAPAVIVSKYARSIPRPAILAENLHFISPSATRPRHTDTRRSWMSYSMPRWSRIATFKERLDTRLGPGDFNRALYGRPKPVS